MFVQTEETPNPSSLKFIADEVQINKGDPIEYKNKKQAADKSPLAEQLFSIAGVQEIFLGSNFITVTKSADKHWGDIKTEIITSITDFLVSKQPILTEEVSKKEAEEDNEIVKQIKELIEVKVRPAVAMDGGDIIYRDFKDGIVLLELKGSCSGCPSSTITLKNGIENMLKHYIPEVLGVEPVAPEDY